MRQGQNLQLSAKISPIFNLRLLGKSLATIFFLASVLVLRFQDQEVILFEEGKFEENLQNAQKADKLCYVKFYTDFCYPCEKADEKLRSSPRLVQLLTDYFVATQIKGWAGNETDRLLAKKYHITSYPTVLITDSEGNEIDRRHIQTSEAEWADFLEQTDGLRTAPVVTPVSDERVNNRWKKKQEFGLIIKSDPDYLTSRKTAEKVSETWKKGVWIFPGKTGGFQTVIGPFADQKEAKSIGKTLKMAENAELIKLEEVPVEYEN